MALRKSYQVKRPLSAIEEATNALSESMGLSKPKKKPVRKFEKVYYYLVWFTNGNTVSGIRKEEDTNLKRLKKRWRDENEKYTITPITAGESVRREE
jgi:hypothetical protein